MATDLERLVLTIEANTKSLERGLKRVEKQIDNAMGHGARSTKKFNSALDGAAVAARGLIAAFAAISAARGAQDLIDKAIGIQNALKVAGLQGEQLTKVYDSLFASAQKNAAPLETLVQLYSRASLVQKELGVSSEQLLAFTDKVAVALRVSGQSAQESSGALLQLAQALGSGVVHAEEFNSILEGALPIAQAAAAGLDEAGGSVAKLRSLVISGRVSSEAFFKAFEAGSVILDQKVAGAELTVSQRFVRLQNVLIDTVGKFDDATGASEAFGEAIDKVSSIVEAMGAVLTKVADSDLAHFVNALAKPINDVAKLLDMIGGLKNLPAFEGALFGVVKDKLAGTNTTQEGLIQNRIDQAFENAAAKTTEKTGRLPEGAPSTATPTIHRVSLADYAAPATKKNGGGSGGGGGGVSEAEKQKKAIDDVVASLKFEQDQLGRTDEEQRLYNELKQAGVERTSAAGQQIETLVTQIEKQKAAMESARELSDLFGNSIVDALSGIISGSSSAEDALKGLVQQLARAALQASLLGEGPLAGIFGTSGGGGILGAIFGGFRAGGGPVSAGTAYEVGEKGRELFIPRTSGTIIPNSALQPPSIRGTPANGNQPVSIHVNVEGANGDQHVISLVRQGVSQGLSTYDKQLTSSFGNRMSRAQQRQI